MGTGSGFPTSLGPVTLKPGLPAEAFHVKLRRCAFDAARGAQAKEQRRKISDLGLVEPARSWPDPSAQGGEIPGPAGGRIVREEIKCHHGVDLPGCDELAQRHGGFFRSRPHQASERGGAGRLRVC